jgi:hypothetical protein
MEKKRMNANDPQAIIDKIFSYDVFNELDKAALVAKLDVTDTIYDINSAIRLQRGQSPQADNVISEIPPQGILISSPGNYTFSADITWSPASVACAAITIVSDNVVLDLGNFNLKATVQDNSQLIAGIFIVNASNVAIRNGALVDMCLYGICAESVSALVIENVTVTGLSFNNLSIRNICPAGIHIDKASQLTIADCAVQYMYVTSDSAAGIQILNTLNGTVSGCRVSNLVNYDGSVMGYSYIKSLDIATANCGSANFQSHFSSNIQTLGHTVLGFVPIFCINLTYANCTATNMIGCCDDCHGMSVFLDALVTVDNFTADTVIDGVARSNSGAKATGLEVYGAEVLISNCSVENIKAINPQDKQGTGFSAWGIGITFINCRANNVVVCDENGNQSPALGYGTGFGWAPDPRIPFRNVGAYQVQYSACSASNCQVGFDTWFHVNSTWTQVSFTNCDINILVEPGASRILSGNPCSECNPPITASITNIASGNTYPPG